MKAMKLIKDHTHGGTEYPVGAVLTVPQATADYMEANGIATPVKDRAPKKQSKGDTTS